MKLRQVIGRYITLKQSLGFRFRAETRILNGFGKAMGKVSVGQVSPVAVRAYLDGQGPVTAFGRASGERCAGFIVLPWLVAWRGGVPCRCAHRKWRPPSHLTFTRNRSCDTSSRP
jgi:hypothetical protein